MYYIGRKLLIIRTEKGMNQGDFGKLFDMSRPTYTDIEKDKTAVDDALLYKMSKVLRMDKDDLIVSTMDKNLTQESNSVRKTFSTTASLSQKSIPFYDTIAVGGQTLLADQTSTVSEPASMIYPGSFLESATGSIRIYGHSMFPKYPAGCIVAYRNADKEVIIWGEDYVIELEDRRIIKRLEKHQEKGLVLAVSYNKSEDYVYAPIDIPIKKIKRLFMVVGKVELEVSI